MEENPDIAVASGMPVLKEGLLQEKTLIARLYDLVKCSADRTGAVACEATIYRFEDLRRVGGFDEKIKGAAEDRDLIARIRLEGLKISTNKKARFFHKQRENVRSIWDELSWTGYGDHYYVHKHGNVALWRKFPAAEFIYFLKLTSGAYRQTRVRLSFIFLLPLIFGNIAWWAGFTRGHLNGYGHAP
jgi:GT2 family glycosyltransferase